MTQLDLVKSFLEDTEIQQKYGLSPADVVQMTMNSQYNSDTQVLVSLIRQMVSVVEDSGTTVNLAASRLNLHLENALR
jgi:pilus assembly protein TadC